MKDRSEVFIRKFKLSSKLIIILFYEKHREYVRRKISLLENNISNRCLKFFDIIFVMDRAGFSSKSNFP